MIIVLDSSSDEEAEVPLRRSNQQLPGSSSSGSSVVDLSPGFRSVAAQAGWDDEALLMAACEAATPDKCLAPADRKREVRTPGHAITPASANRVYRKPRRPDSIFDSTTIISTSSAGFSLQKEIDKAGEAETISDEPQSCTNSQTQENKVDTYGGDSQAKFASQKEIENGKEGSTEPAFLEQLRDELSCAVCLDICFEPSTTSCGHSFCSSCLRSVIRKCGLRCPKCRQILKGEGAINVVLRNTIQILFPDDVARKLQSQKEGEVEDQQPIPVSSSRGSSSQTNNRNNRQVSVDRNRPIGNFRRFTAPFRASQRHSSAASENSGNRNDEEANARRQQEEIDAALAARLQEAELMQQSQGSTGTGVENFHRRLRREQPRRSARFAVFLSTG